MNYKLFNLNVHGDQRGKLISLESCKDIVPFQIKRIYWIFDTLPDQSRGSHAHKNLEQIVVAIDGSVDFILDDGFKREEITLNRPDIGLFIGKNMWREMHNFSYGCKIIVIASDYYNESEYIRDYKKFLDTVKFKLNNNLVNNLKTL
jgi:dTDP-4-dehydrorhamnose 3,5-epimerase-like enzyme